PGGSVAVGRTVVPSASSVWSTRVQQRSAHTSTRAPVVPAGSAQWNDGRCEVTLDTDCGTIGRGGAIAGSPARTPASPVHSLPGNGTPSGSTGTSARRGPASTP